MKQNTILEKHQAITLYIYITYQIYYNNNTPGIEPTSFFKDNIVFVNN